ncbi:hypothetical protein F8388_004999 [Cannabis sativa]|uniref:RNase H type-1 domain-containing protein n=1 Tax=Cannabis sativa TaxID=3483 RepID=A0A7J6G1L4_CANSA|nr:hypothetical protein F8388_004999 [Cannabis sativa]
MESLNTDDSAQMVTPSEEVPTVDGTTALVQGTKGLLNVRKENATMGNTGGLLSLPSRSSPPVSSILGPAQTIVTHDITIFSDMGQPFSGSKKRKAPLSIIPVITPDENIINLGNKSGSSSATLLPPLEVNTFTPGSSGTKNDSSTRRKSKRRLRTDSWVWKGILNSKNILRMGSHTLVGKGDTIDIWEQPLIPWLDYEDFKALMNNIRLHHPLLTSVADLINYDGEWNYNLVVSATIHCIPPDLKSNFFTFLGCLFESVWKARNESIFRGQIPKIDHIRRSFLCRYEEAITDGQAGIGVILLDQASNNWKWFAKFTYAASAAEAKMLAILWALQLGEERHFDSIAIMSDALLLVNALQKRQCPPLWEARKLYCGFYCQEG